MHNQGVQAGQDSRLSPLADARPETSPPLWHSLRAGACARPVFWCHAALTRNRKARERHRQHFDKTWWPGRLPHCSAPEHHRWYHYVHWGTWSCYVRQCRPLVSRAAENTGWQRCYQPRAVDYAGVQSLPRPGYLSGAAADLSESPARSFWCLAG